MSYIYDHGGNAFSAARQLGVRPDEIIDFSASINPLGLSPQVKEAIICALDSLQHYPDSSHHDLRQALAQFHNLSPANFALANGSTELIYNLPALLPGKKALVISPSFSEYVRALSQHQWEIQHFILSPDSNFAIDTDKLEHALASGIDALYLCNPGNPNGSLHPQQVIERIYTLCRASGTFLVLDEAFMDFCEDASAKQFVVNSDHAVVLRSMTKFFGIPGLRLGYAICSPNLAGQLDAMGGPWSVNTLAQVAGVAALQDSSHNLRTIKLISQERRNLQEKLERFSQLKVYPSDVNYLLIEIIAGMTAKELRDRLLPHCILIRDCSSFMGLSGNFFRVAVRTRQENNRLLECLEGVLV